MLMLIWFWVFSPIILLDLNTSHVNVNHRQILYISKRKDI